MSYAPEPYGLFANDLLLNLTGGVSRVRFRFVNSERPFRIGEHEDVRPDSVAVHGLVDGAFRLFVRTIDYAVGTDGEILWNESEPGVPAAGAVLPDQGSTFYASFDRTAGGRRPPALTDRNPGSITRTLAEAFALEFAVVSHQLDQVYRSAFLATAEGDDLDRVTELVGVSRRGQVHARGEVVLSRTTPAPAEVTIPAGTLVSTSQPPPVTVETTQTVTLRRGTLSVSAPVQAQVTGPGGVATAGSLTVLHRPILGVEEVTNPTPLTFGGGKEDDVALRQRASRALETSGRATVGAIRGALASLEGVREQDVRVEEDHLAFPGVIKVTVAADLDAETMAAAARLLEEHRPAGIRVVHSLEVPTLPPPGVGSESNGGGDGPTTPGTADGIWYPLAIHGVVTPASTNLTDIQRDRLHRDVAAAIAAAVEAVGVGEPLVYNRVVAAVMAVEGVLDAVLDIAPASSGEPVTGRHNIRVPAGTRPLLEDQGLTVELRGALIALDVTVEVQRLGLAVGGDAASELEKAAEDIQQRLEEALLVTPDVLSQQLLADLLTDTATYHVHEVGYLAEFVDEGLRITEANVTIDVGSDQQVWVRGITAVEAVVSG